MWRNSIEGCRKYVTEGVNGQERKNIEYRTEEYRMSKEEKTGIGNRETAGDSRQSTVENRQSRRLL